MTKFGSVCSAARQHRLQMLPLILGNAGVTEAADLRWSRRQWWSGDMPLRCGPVIKIKGGESNYVLLIGAR
jgi:hypothetical protein